MLPGQRRHNVNVIRSVPDRDPAHAGLVIAGREPGPVHDRRCDLTPLLVGQHPVPRRSPDRAVPYGLLAAAKRIKRQRLQKQPSQPPQVWRPVRPPVRLQLPRIPKPSHQMRVGVLIRPTRAVQIPQQSPDV